MISLPAGAVPLAPALIETGESDTVVCVSSSGYMLAFPLADVPELAKGKGNKLINIPPKRLKSGEESVVGLVVMGDKDEILVWAGQRYLRMAAKDVDHFRGERALRGRKLPRGYQRVTRIELDRKQNG
jgi:topoisomerase-4 subunit A